MDNYFAIKKQKKSIKRKVKTLTFLILFLTIIILIFSYFINPVILTTLELKAQSLSTKAMNSAISDVVMNSIVYDDLINIITDDYGNIKLIQANALEVNNLSKNLAQTSENRIEEYGRNGISIPIGTFTGMPIFVGRGPDITFRINLVGSINCHFLSKFESAGINQTNHKIYLILRASVGVIMPLSTKRFLTEQQVLICESLIVGQIPEVYFNSTKLDSLLNFIP